jgi:hypothetical protein
LGIVGLQIETKRIFSLAEIFTNFKEMSFANRKFRTIDFCQQKLGLE